MAAFMDAAPSPIWVIDLTTLDRPVLVPPTVAALLGVSEQPGRPVIDALVDVLRSRTCLLLLDNCEHVVDACAQLAEHMLRMCSGFNVLSTSRQPLGVSGETVLRVPPLSLPASVIEEVQFASTLAESEAVRLSVERTHSAVSSCGVTDQNANAVGSSAASWMGFHLRSNWRPHLYAPFLQPKSPPG